MPSFTVHYTALHFHEPTERISEKHFIYYRQELLKDKNFKFYWYISYWKFIKITLIIFVVSSLVTWGCWSWVIDGEEPINGTVRDVVTGVLILAGLVAFYESYVWSAETNSYIKYRKDLIKYYENMKSAILKATSYDAFIGDFYGKQSVNLDIN